MEIFEGVITPPYSAQWIDIPRNPHCLVCGDQHARAALSLDELASDLLVEQDQADQHIGNQ